MESILGLAISAGYFVLIFQFLAPFFSRREVSFAPAATIGPKLLFGLLMSLGYSIILGIFLSIFGVFFVAFFAGALAAPVSGVLAVISVLLFAVLGVFALQVPCWLMTLALGKMMPETIKVTSSRAAWRASWANTLISFIPAAFLVFLAFAGALVSLHVY